VVWVCLTGGAVEAQEAPSVEARLDDAIAAYREAMDIEDRDTRLEAFKKAQRLFESVLETSAARNADLYTNLGNAALGAQRLGPAIAAYRRALTLDPGHARARQNLTHARRLVPAWAPRPEDGSQWDTFFFWRGAVSASTTVWLTALVFAVGMVLLAVSIRYRQAWARHLGVVALLFWAALFGIGFWEGGMGGGADWRVVVADEAVARSADAINAPPRFAEPLPGGVELELIEEREGWAHVRLADGRDAWLHVSALAGPEGDGEERKGREVWHEGERG
jgi:tetratricopeptide (TPR) repeat protein